jgi:type IV pilus assembly protein PilA
MLARIRKSINEKDQGFTLIELLVVMIIIGILAAIAIPVFLSQREKARDTSTKADVSTIGKEIATYYVDGTGKVTLTQAAGAGTDIVVKDDATPTANTLATIKVSNGTALAATPVKYATGTPTPPNATAWCVALTNATGKVKTYNYSGTTGLTANACA